MLASDLSQGAVAKRVIDGTADDSAVALVTLGGQIERHRQVGMSIKVCLDSRDAKDKGAPLAALAVFPGRLRAEFNPRSIP